MSVLEQWAPLAGTGGGVGLLGFILGRVYLDKYKDRESYQLIIKAEQEKVRAVELRAEREAQAWAVRAAQEAKVYAAKIAAADTISDLARKRADEERSARIKSEDAAVKRIDELRDTMRKLQDRVASLERLNHELMSAQGGS